VQRGNNRKIYIFRHNKYEASWSQFNEPVVYTGTYMFAEMVIVAFSLEEAYELAAKEKDWFVDELKKITPRIVELDESAVVTKFIT